MTLARLLSLLCGLVLLVASMLPLVAMAKGRSETIARPADPINVSVELGSLEGDLHFHPDQLSFKAGKTYRLHLSNPSPLKHYFTAKDFADAIWTRKVEVAGAEVKGKINNVELQPGASLDWIFRPELEGTYRLECTIAGHAESGMVGSITISAS